MMRVVCRWLQGRTWILIGDGAYACLHLAQACIKNGVALISRLRMDAQLYDFPEEATAGQRGRKRIKGKRIKLREYLNDESQDWATVEVKWYGRKKKTVTLLSKICLWYQAGKPPVKLRFVLVVDPTNDNNPEVFFSTDVNLAMTKIIEYFVLRWNIEVTFEEIREHLGMETQRQWSDKAIARTTPLLMGIYSLVILFALQLKELHNLTPLSTAWYQKNNEASFSDIIAFVRRIIWAEKYFSKSSESEDFIKIERVELNSLITQLARTG